MLPATLAVLSIVRASLTCDVRDYGAVGDGVTLDTAAMQRAISDARCSTVLLSEAASPSSAAVFLSGTLRLRSHLSLLVAPGVTLRGASAPVYDLPEPNAFDAYQDFGHSHWENALLWARGAANLTLAGGGVIDGGGALGPGGDMPDGYGDKLLSLVSCAGVALQDLSLRRSGHFALLATNVTRLELRRLDVAPTRDGVDLVGCADVVAAELRIEGGGDDAFVLKSDYSLGAVLPTRNVTLTDSVLGTRGATALEIGSESVGDFENLRFRNLTVTSAGNGAIGMAVMDGGAVRDVEYRDIRVTGAASPLQFYIGARQSGHPPGTGRPLGSIRDVRVVNLAARDMSNHGHPGPPRNWTAMIDGMPRGGAVTGASDGAPVGPNITLQNLTLRFRGGGTAAGGNAALEPPHPPLGWSDTGPWPSWGLFVRHAVGVTLRGVALSFDDDDGRPALALEDAAGAVLEDVTAQRGAAARPFDVLVRRGCPGLRIEGGNVTANRTDSAISIGAA